MPHPPHSYCGCRACTDARFDAMMALVNAADNAPPLPVAQALERQRRRQEATQAVDKYFDNLAVR